jgi:hypothetical protein
MCYLKEGRHPLILNDTLKLRTATNLMPSVKKILYWIQSTIMRSTVGLSADK